MSFHIRPFNIEDTESILEIINDNILNSTALYDYEPRTLEQQISIFKTKLENNFPIIVAVNAEKILGFGYYSEFRFRDAYRFTVEHSVYVRDGEKGLGVGKTLLSELIALAKNQKMHTMVAVIDSENEDSIAFHKNFGFQTIGVIKESGFKFNRWLDSVLMQLMLEE